jgi:hypothetical protein
MVRQRTWAIASGEVRHHQLQGRVIISRAPVSYRADGVSGHGWLLVPVGFARRDGHHFYFVGKSGPTSGQGWERSCTSLYDSFTCPCSFPAGLRVDRLIGVKWRAVVHDATAPLHGQQGPGEQADFVNCGSAWV